MRNVKPFCFALLFSALLFAQRDPVVIRGARVLEYRIDMEGLKVDSV